MCESYSFIIAISRAFSACQTADNNRRQRSALRHDRWIPFSDQITYGRDRYSNIRVWSSNRVQLKVPEGMNDYINASPINMVSPWSDYSEQYVVMQGPIKSTVDHVWRMAWDESSGPIVFVMLTELKEGDMPKCYPYFPTDAEKPIEVNECDEYGDGFRATVRFVERESTPYDHAIVARKSIMTKGEEEKEVWHLQFIQMADFGVVSEQNVDAFFHFIRLSREKNNYSHNPRFVHCSAGVGRSGVFLAMEYLLVELEKGSFGQVEDENDPIYYAVDYMRQGRGHMVQTNEQYKFLYQALKGLWIEKYWPQLEGSPQSPRLPEINQGRLSTVSNPDPFV
jgi:protein-tyrosine phosphatase